MGWSTGSFVSYARELKVAVAPDPPFLTPKTPPPNAVRLSLGSIQDLDRFTQVLELIAGMLGRLPEGISPLMY